MSEKKEYISQNEADSLMANSVLPIAIFEGEDENNVIEVITVASTRLQNENTYGLPSSLTLELRTNDGDIFVGEYTFNKILPR